MQVCWPSVVFLCWSATTAAHLIIAAGASELDDVSLVVPQLSVGLPATTGLLYVLIKSVFAVLLGFACVRYGIFSPSKGHTLALGFYVGKVGLPLLLFKTVATAKLGSLNYGVVFAVGLGKTIIYALGFFVAYLAYQPNRDRPQRILTANLFGSFGVATMDFPMGLPVMDALYGQKMTMYIAAATLFCTVLLQPPMMVIFELAKSRTVAASAVDTPPTNSTMSYCKYVFKLTCGVMLSPLMLWTVLGLLYKVALSWTLVTDPSGDILFLPHPLSDIVDFVAGAFPMMALFLTGTTLSSAKFEVWPAFLVLTKVVVCAYLSFFLGMMFIPGQENELQDFTFFYGCLPTGTPALVFALQFDPGSQETIASAILLGLLVSGPVMYATALFLKSGQNENFNQILLEVQFNTAICSAFLGTLALALLATSWRTLRHPYRVVALLCTVTVVYNILNAALMKRHTLCHSFDLVKAFASCQNMCRLLVLYLQFVEPGTQFLARHWSRFTWPSVLAVMVLSALFALFIPANTINEVCDLDFSANNLWFVTGWVAMLFILASVLMWRSALSWRRAVSSERGVHYSLSEEDQEAKNLVMGLSAFVALRLMIQVVNCVTSLIDKDANVYAQMLIIEGLLEHGQGVVLLFLLVGVVPVKRSASLILAWVSERRHVYGRYLSMSTLVPFAVHDPTISFLVETPEQALLEPTRLRPMSLNLESERAACQEGSTSFE